MELTEIAENTSRGKTGSALITIILAGFLWVGKTTFEHVGQIAGMQHELDTSHQDRNLLRGQYDEIVQMLNDRTKSRFTREDSEKIVDQIKEVEAGQHAFKDSLLRDYTALKLEVATVVANSDARQSQPAAPTVVAAQHLQQLEVELASLQAEVIRLRHQVSLTRGSGGSVADAPGALIAQPNLNRVPLTKKR